MTIGINFVFKVITIDSVRIKLQIWDTAGQDKYKTITQSYYRNSQGVFVVFGINDRDSFHSVRTPLIKQAHGFRIYLKLLQNQHKSSLSATKWT